MHGEARAVLQALAWLVCSILAAAILFTSDDDEACRAWARDARAPAMFAACMTAHALLVGAGGFVMVKQAAALVRGIEMDQLRDLDRTIFVIDVVVYLVANIVVLLATTTFADGLMWVVDPRGRVFSAGVRRGVPWLLSALLILSAGPLVFLPVVRRDWKGAGEKV